jgi:hypothetical protein
LAYNKQQKGLFEIFKQHNKFGDNDCEATNAAKPKTTSMLLNKK